jgi:hypothetical protein
MRAVITLAAIAAFSVGTVTAVSAAEVCKDKRNHVIKCVHVPNHAVYIAPARPVAVVKPAHCRDKWNHEIVCHSAKVVVR